MLRKTLTEEGVAKLKTPATGQIDIFDVLVPGLILRVGYGGSKTWLARFYIHRRNHAQARPPSDPEGQGSPRQGAGVPRRSAEGQGAS